MWAWRGVLCVSLACGLALDSNTIRSSKEVESQVRSHSDEGDGARTNASANSRRTPACSSTDCLQPPTGGCSNRAQRRPSPQDREAGTITETHAAGFNGSTETGGGCVRSADCGAGLCCVRYLTGKRCQPIPAQGDACLLRGVAKLRRNLGRCDCGEGLVCTASAAAAAANTPQTGRVKGQGVCLPRQRRGQRKTRHSGKKSRTAESGC